MSAELTGLAAVAVAAATGLLIGPGTSPARAIAVGTTAGRRRWMVVGGGGAVAGLLVVATPRLAVLVLLTTAVVVGGARLLAAHRLSVASQRERQRVVELCEALEAELAAGQTPIAALARAAEEWPLLGPASRVAAAGGDVPSSLRSLAGQPGTAALRVVAAAWQVAHRAGHGLADSLSRVATDLRAVEQTRRIVTGELASARATARLLAVLPAFALAIGSGAGANPWAFLVGHPVGLACLVSGLAFAYLGLAWIEALARDVERGS